MYAANRRRTKPGVARSAGRAVGSARARCRGLTLDRASVPDADLRATETDTHETLEMRELIAIPEGWQAEREASAARRGDCPMMEWSERSLFSNT